MKIFITLLFALAIISCSEADGKQSQNENTIVAKAQQTKNPEIASNTAVVKNTTKKTSTEPGETYYEGIEYQKIPSPFANDAPAGSVAVQNIFWYGCPHCYALNPVMKAWKKPKYIKYSEMPAISPRGWAAISAQAFFTAEVLGILDKVNDKMFDEIHQLGNRKLLSDIPTIAKFFEQYGIDEKQFYSTWNSFSVDTKLKKAAQIFKRSGIDGVPSLIVAGKYVTSITLTGSGKRMLKVIEYLAQKELGKVKQD